MFDNRNDDDKEELFDGFEPEEPKAPKQPRYSPDDPRYWDNPESEWEHLRPAGRRRKVTVWASLVLGLIVVVWLLIYWFCGPYVQDAVQYGYVDHVEERGNVFKTYEGNLIPYKSMHDTTRVFEGDFVFSTSGNIGKALRTFQNSGKPLRVEYRTYRYAMPWRGDSRTVIIRVDTVSPDSILPLPNRLPRPASAVIHEPLPLKDTLSSASSAPEN